MSQRCKQMLEVVISSAPHCNGPSNLPCIEIVGAVDILKSNSNPELDLRLTELVLAWEDAWTANRTLTPAEFCRDCPEMLPALQKCLAELQQFDRLFASTSDFSSRVVHAELGTGDIVPRLPIVPGYDLIEEIGRGGMGVVYKARQKSLGRIVAIKTLPGSHWGMSGYAARLRQEAKGLSRVNHPNVVKIIDVVETVEAAAIVLEYVEGESLADRLKQASISPDEAASIAFELSMTLVNVHSCGLLHRDVKPANVLLNLRGEIKLADFGLVKEAGHESGLTETGTCFGTAMYMPPEQAAGRVADLDVRIDVYAVGATLYEMLSGRPPFIGATPLEILDQVQHRDPVPLRLLNPKIPRDLETICLRCLEKEPARRMPNAQVLADELDRYRRRLPILSRSIGPVERVRRWCRRRPAVASLIALSFLSTLAIVGLLLNNLQNLTNYNRDLTNLNIHLKKLNDELDRSASTANHLRDLAEEHERQMRDALYAADINRAALAWRQDNTHGMMTLLERHLPVPGQVDQRGFEWWFLYGRAHRSHLTLLELKSAQYFLAYTPDQRLMAVAGFDAVVRLFDPSTGVLLKEIATGQIEVNGASFSPDAKELATAGDDGTIRFWNLDTGMERLKLNSQHRKAYQLVYTPDGKQLISCGDDAVIQIFDCRTGEAVSTLTGHQSDVQCMLLANNGRTLVSAGNDDTARLWNLDTKQQIGQFTALGDVDTIIYLSDRQLLIAGDASGSIHTVDMQQSRTISTTKHLDKIGAIALHPKGELLAAGDASGQIRLRRLSSNGVLSDDEFTPWHAHEKLVYGLVWSADGSKLISTGMDGRVVSWSLAAMESVGQNEIDLRCSRRLCLIPNSTSFLVRTEDQHLMRWDWKSRKKVSESKSELLFHIATSSDATMFAALIKQPLATVTEGIRIYALPGVPERPLDEQPIAEWRTPGDLSNPRISPDGKSIAVSHWHQKIAGEEADHTIWILTLPDATQSQKRADDVLPQFKTLERIPVPFAQDSAFSPDGKTIALVTRTGLVHWDLQKKRVLWEVPNSTMTRATFTPDGSLVAVAGQDRTIQLLNTKDGSVRFKSTDHRGPIGALAFSPDNRLLVSATKDGTIKIWHVATGQELMEFPYPGTDVLQVGFTGDGKHLIAQLSSDAPDQPHKILILDGARFEQ